MTVRKTKGGTSHPAAPPPSPTRYAHPFFTTTPNLATAQPQSGGHAHVSSWAKTNLGPIPNPTKGTTVDLSSIIGAAGVQEIQDAGAIRLHATGDTGRHDGGGAQEDVAAAMSSEYTPGSGASNPAFFLHLGDVIYGPGKDALYRDEFYRPYKNYPGKIVALAGNHDGETFPTTDPTPLRAFKTNFCAAAAGVPSIAKDVGIFRETMTLPGVYWLLDAPFVQIVGLYSNIVDGPGFLEGAGNDTQQTDWLVKTFKQLAQTQQAAGHQRKALVVAVHHPPFSNGGHGGSPDVLKGLDAACQAAGIMPDAVLSGHAHNYQHHNRHVAIGSQSFEVPFIVAGCGGHGEQTVQAANGQVIGDRTYEKSLEGYGYLLVTASNRLLTIEMRQVDGATVTSFDTVTVNLQTHRVV